jgi:hypothetical protein
VGCEERGHRQWLERDAAGAWVHITPKTIRQQAVRERGHLKVPAAIRPCPSCRSWRSAQNAGNYFRLTCRNRTTCDAPQRSTLYTKRGEHVPLERRRYHGGIAGRPLCPHCEKWKTKRAVTLGGIGQAFAYMCPRRTKTPECPSSPDVKTPKGVLLSPQERARLRSESRLRAAVPIPGFDLAKRLALTRCPRCARPMVHTGMTRDKSARAFRCARGHEAVRLVLSIADGSELPPRVPFRKAMPWGARKPCPKCGGDLTSLGEGDDASGRHLYEMRCQKNPGCHGPRLFYTARGVLVREAKRYVRLPVNRSRTSTRPRRCLACGKNAVSNPADPRVKYCGDCGADGNTARRIRQRDLERDVGPEVARCLRLLRSGPDVARIRKRHEPNLTQAELAERAGCSLALVKKLEADTATLTAEKRKRFAVVLSQ